MIKWLIANMLSRSHCKGNSPDLHIISSKVKSVVLGILSWLILVFNILEYIFTNIRYVALVSLDYWSCEDIVTSLTDHICESGDEV